MTRATCGACGSVFDLPAVAICPECGSRQVRRYETVGLTIEPSTIDRQFKPTWWVTLRDLEGKPTYSLQADERVLEGLIQAVKRFTCELCGRRPIDHTSKRVWNICFTCQDIRDKAETDERMERAVAREEADRG